MGLTGSSEIAPFLPFTHGSMDVSRIAGKISEMKTPSIMVPLSLHNLWWLEHFYNIKTPITSNI